MNGAWGEFAVFDLMPLLAGTLAAVTCALLGNFLVLRRQSLMGDAISHAVLPGLVIAFLVSGTRDTGAMFLGAAVAGVGTAVLIETVRRLGRVEPGAAMGVVFSVMFALGVLLIERAAARNTDLDAGCVLHGQLETLFWLPPEGEGVFSAALWASVPRQVWTLAGMLVATVTFVALLYKEMRAVCFDPAHATSQGIHAGVMHHVLMVLVAGATVASFEAVGSILVIAMLICPPAVARLMTDRYLSQIVLSGVVAAASGVIGYFGATRLPGVVGMGSVNAAGAIAVASGVLLLAAVVMAPVHGVVPRLVRRRRLGREVAVEDLIAGLYRLGEQDVGSVPAERLGVLAGVGRSDWVVSFALRRGLIEASGGRYGLTPGGVELGRGLVRRHRLWESFLVDEAGLAADHVHETAERLEHLGVEPLHDQNKQTEFDPHGRPIPGESGSGGGEG